MKTTKILLFIAKIWATVVALFIGFFLAAHAIEGIEIDSTEIEIIFLFFPLLVFIGNGLVFYRDFLGASLALIGFAVFFSYDPRVMTDPLFMLGLFPPSLTIVCIQAIQKLKSKQLK